MFSLGPLLWTVGYRGECLISFNRIWPDVNKRSWREHMDLGHMLVQAIDAGVVVPKHLGTRVALRRILCPAIRLGAGPLWSRRETKSEGRPSCRPKHCTLLPRVPIET